MFLAKLSPGERGRYGQIERKCQKIGVAARNCAGDERGSLSQYCDDMTMLPSPALSLCATRLVEARNGWLPTRSDRTAANGRPAVQFESEL